MKKSINNYRKFKSVERAFKLKDLEVAKSIEIDLERKDLNNTKNETYNTRSDLAKE
ncbi:hypothetical protein [Natronospora cellulosivora (SeqCode)]